MQARCRRGALGLALAVWLGCTVETLEAVPAYPGAALGSGSRQELEGQLLLKQSYQTPEVREFVLSKFKGAVLPSW